MRVARRGELGALSAPRPPEASQPLRAQRLAPHSQKPGMEAFAISARQAQLCTAFEQHDAVASEPRLHLDDAIDVHNVPPVNSQELLGVELALDARRRRANQMIGWADV